jgi:hypothetical protein
MARTKPQTIVGSIKDNKHADEVMRELAEINRTIQKAQDDLNKVIAEEKAVCESYCELKLKRKKALETSLQAMPNTTKTNYLVANAASNCCTDFSVIANHRF